MPPDHALLGCYRECAEEQEFGRCRELRAIAIPDTDLPSLHLLTVPAP